MTEAQAAIEMRILLLSDFPHEMVIGGAAGGLPVLAAAGVKTLPDHRERLKGIRDN
ncbi:MAG TPA: hypothetical protein VFJ72_07060 [Rubrobacteraceae bacterium]|nr:hypothetical protein [Rubrobacteraceae bacterium]